MRPEGPPDDQPTKPRGRPRADVKMEEVVSVRLPTAQYEQLRAIAESRDTHVSTLVRQLVIIRLR